MNGDPFETVELVGGPAWCVSGSRDLALMMRALPSLVPEMTDLHLDGFSMAEDVAVALAPFTIETVPRGRVTLAITPAVFEVLAQLAERHAEPVICHHMIGFADAARVLEWFDIPADPVYLGMGLPAQRVIRVCGEFGLTCNPLRGNA